MRAASAAVCRHTSLRTLGVPAFMRRFFDGYRGRFSPLTQPWLLTVLVIQGVGWWIYNQQHPIDEVSVPVYGLSLVVSLSFWYVVNRGVERLGAIGRTFTSLLISLAVALLLVGSYQCYVEFGEFFSASMLQYAGKGGTSTFLRYIADYLEYPLDLFFYGTIAVVTVAWYTGAPTQVTPGEDGHRATVGALGIFVTSLGATVAVAPGHHLSPDTALLTAGMRSLGVPDERPLRTPDRRAVPDLPDGRKTDQPNVLLIVNESLGTQELELSGQRTDQMPYLQSWIRRAPSQFFAFRRAYANSTSTDLSVPTMLTGVGPHRPIDDLHEVPMVWDWARRAGLSPFYVSAQNYSSTNFPAFFFDDDPMPVFTPNSLDGRADEDFALDELVAADQFGKLLADVPDDQPFFAVYNSNAMHKPFQQRSSLLDEQPRRGTRYRNAMYILDRALERVLESVRREGRLQNTIVIMTSDHGEYPERIHRVPRILSLYEEFIRVPMLVRIPERWRRHHPEAADALATNQTRNVTNLDIVPTVVDLLGYDDEQAAPSLRRELSGESLLAPVPTDRTIVALNNNAVRHWEHKGFGIFWKDWRLVFTDVQGPRLFDIAEDPRQQRDRWDEAPREVREHMLRTLRENRFLREIWTTHRTPNRPRTAD